MSSDAVSLAAALSAFVLIGWLVVAAVLRGRARPGLALLLPLAFAVGTGALAWQMFVLSIAGLAWPSPWLLASPWLLLLVPALWRGRRREPAASPGDLPLARDHVWVLWLAAAACILVVLFNLLTVHVLALERPTFGFDALTRWMFKPRIFFTDGSVLPYFADPERGDTQPHYPPLSALSITWLYMLLGRVDDRLGKIVFVAAYAALVLATYGIARRLLTRTFALLAAAVLSAIPCLAYLNEPPGSGPPGIGAHTAMLDVTLGLLNLLGAGLLLLWIREREVRLLILACVVACFAALTKQEGALLLVLVVLVAGAVGLARRTRPRRALATAGWLLLVVGVLYLPWYLFQRQVPVTDTVYLPMHFTLDNLVGHLDRIPAIAARFAAEFVSLKLWNLFWVLVGAACLLAPRSLLRFPSGPLLLLVSALVLAHATVYYLEEFLGTGAYLTKMDLSLTRVLMQVAPLAALLLAAQAEVLARAGLHGFLVEEEGTGKR